MRRSSCSILALTACLAATAADARPLRIARAALPDAHCLFDRDCTVAVTDSTGVVRVPAASGSGFLQTRTLPPSEISVTAGLHAYEYRLDLRGLRGRTEEACVSRLELDFGPVTPLDYDRAGRLEDVFVLTRGAVGEVGLAAAEESAGRVALTFERPVCPGESSFFLGMASTAPPSPATARLTLTLGLDPLTVDVRVPSGEDDRGDWSTCLVEPGDQPIPIPRFVPLCRCLRDATLREFRCALLHPDFFVVRRVPWPVPPGPFTERWILRPLTRLSGPVAIETALPPGFESPQAGQVPLRFSADVPVGSEATIEIPLAAGPNAGAFDVKAHLDYGGEGVDLRFAPAP